MASNISNKEYSPKKYSIPECDCFLQSCTDCFPKSIKSPHQNVTTKRKFTSDINKKEYKPPLFTDAVREYLFAACQDLKTFPNINDCLANTEKCGIFPTTIPIYNKQQTTTNYHTNKQQTTTNYHTNEKRERCEIDTIIKKGMVVASAGTQSCKTNFIQCFSIISMIDGKTPIIVLRNLTGDALQFESRCDALVKNLENYLSAKNVKEDFKITILRGNKLDDQICSEKLDQSLKGGCPRIVVCLGNEAQLKKIVKATKNYEGKFDLFIDEIDNVDYGTKTVTKIVDGKEVKVGELCGTAFALKILKEKAHQVIGVTATPLDCIFSEKDLKSVNQLRLSPPEDYRGLLDIEVKLLDHETSSLSKASSFEIICEADPNLKNFLTEFAKSKAGFAWNIKEYIPNICLIKKWKIDKKSFDTFLRY